MDRNRGTSIVLLFMLMACLLQYRTYHTSSLLDCSDGLVSLDGQNVGKFISQYGSNSRTLRDMAASGVKCLILES